MGTMARYIKHKTRNAGRASGGCVYAFKKHLIESFSTKFLFNNNDVCISIIIKGKTCNLVPRYINCNNWSFDFNALDNFLTNLRSESFCVFGDLNARVGNAQIFDEQLFDGYPYVTHKRNSKDSVIDSKGRQVLELFENIGAVILNGRHVGDTEGNFTFQRGTARSVIDFAACSFDILGLISSFSVPVKEYSNHMPIIVNLCIPDKKKLAVGIVSIQSREYMR